MAAIEAAAMVVAGVPTSASALEGSEDPVVTGGDNPAGASVGAKGGGAVSEGRRKRNRIQVSTNKKPLYFYVNLAKRIMQQHNEVVLSALGMAIGTVVIISEILKKNGFATEKKILTSTVDAKDESKGRLVQKAKIEILLGKSENFNDLVAAGKVERINSGGRAAAAEATRTVDFTNGKDEGKAAAAAAATTSPTKTV